MGEYSKNAQATLEISSTMFGIAPIQFSMADAPIEGAGSVATMWAGMYEGKIWYHSLQDMSGKRYKLECYLDSGRLVMKFLDPQRDWNESMIFCCEAIISPNHGETKFSGIIKFG